MVFKCVIYCLVVHLVLVFFSGLAMVTPYFVKLAEKFEKIASESCEGQSQLVLLTNDNRENLLYITTMRRMIRNSLYV